MMWLRRNWRTLLARLPLPMLALAASWGVYSFAALYVPWPIAVIQAAAFELTYIGLAISQHFDAAQRRRATAISVGAVVVSVLYNSIDGLFARNPSWLAGLPPGAEIAGAVLHGAPLAVVAYLVADLLLHSGAPQPSRRPRQLRAVTRRLTHLLRTARALAASLQVEIAQLRAELEAARAALEEAQRTAAEQARTHAAALRGREQELARLQEAAAQPLMLDSVDLLTIARALRDRGVSSRETAQLIGVPEATLRARLGKAATNGVHA